MTPLKGDERVNALLNIFRQRLKHRYAAGSLRSISL